MTINVFSNPEKVSEAAAHLFTGIATRAVEKKGRFIVALSGGGSPQRMYELLASKPFINQVPWGHTFVFWGDERFVPPEDSENNARMTRKKLLDHVPLPPDNIFPIPTFGEPEAAAEQYASTLASTFGDSNAFPRFDFILLGLGENGHTASLFPKKAVLQERKKWVDSLFIKDKDQYRITLTVPVINNAENIVFLVYGSKKAETLSAVLEGPRKPHQLPAQLVHPKSGSLAWYVDEAAGKFLQTNGQSS